MRPWWRMCAIGSAEIDYHTKLKMNEEHQYQDIESVIETCDNTDVKTYTSKGWRLLLVSERRTPDTDDKTIVYVLGKPFGLQ